MGVPRYLGWLVLASVETRWNVMGAWPPSHMQSLIFARICLHDELGMWPLNLLTKVMYLTSESLWISGTLIVFRKIKHPPSLSVYCP